MAAKFASYDDFFLYYLRQHSDARNRLLHACGTSIGTAVVVGAFTLGHRWFALLFLPIGYGFAWIGHLVVERNKPATWGYPWWSFVSDFRMVGLMLTGKIDGWMQRAEAQPPEEHSSAAGRQ
jgi:hypothetical protein